eukprot:129269-Prymnesium_polylepis.1
MCGRAAGRALSTWSKTHRDVLRTICANRVRNVTNRSRVRPTRQAGAEPVAAGASGRRRSWTPWRGPERVGRKAASAGA